jgi:hypothetical protein
VPALDYAGPSKKVDSGNPQDATGSKQGRAGCEGLPPLDYVGPGKNDHDAPPPLEYVGPSKKPKESMLSSTATTSATGVREDEPPPLEYVGPSEGERCTQTFSSDLSEPPALEYVGPSDAERRSHTFSDLSDPPALEYVGPSEFGQRTHSELSGETRRKQTFVAGDAVALKGSAVKEMNGQRGVVLQLRITDGGKIPVKMQGVRLLVKAENIEKVAMQNGEGDIGHKALQDEFRSLKNSELRDRALRYGATQAEVDAAINEEDVKSALFKLAITGAMKACPRLETKDEGKKNKTYVAVLDCTRARLGLEVDTSAKTFPCVNAINGGAAEVWNMFHPEKKIEIGDRIIQVNDVTKDAASFMVEVRKASLAGQSHASSPLVSLTLEKATASHELRVTCKNSDDFAQGPSAALEKYMTAHKINEDDFDEESCRIVNIATHDGQNFAEEEVRELETRFPDGFPEAWFPVKMKLSFRVTQAEP